MVKSFVRVRSECLKTQTVNDISMCLLLLFLLASLTASDVAKERL